IHPKLYPSSRSLFFFYHHRAHQDLHSFPTRRSSDLQTVYQMNKDEIIDKFKEILEPYAQNPQALENFSIESDFIKDLEINSTNLVDVFLDIEEVFDIEIENAALEQIQNSADAIAIITRKMEEKNN